MLSIVHSNLLAPRGIASSAIGLKICAVAVGIEKYKLLIKKKKKQHDKMVLLAKSKLNSIEVIIFRALVDWNISHEEFVEINNVCLRNTTIWKKKSKT